MSKLIDLSHTIEDGLVTYQGLAPPIICDYISREASKEYYDEGTTFQIGKIEMVSNTGTYIDVPFHRYADGTDLSDTVLDKFVAPETVVIRCDYLRDGLSIEPVQLQNMDLKGKAVLFHTKWSKHWNTETYYTNHPFIAENTAQILLNQKVKMVGIDSYNVDDTRKKTRPVHSLLLKNDILIVEHMTGLDQLPDSGFEFHAVPPKIKGMGTFPVRAFARIKEKPPGFI